MRIEVGTRSWMSAVTLLLAGGLGLAAEPPGAWLGVRLGGPVARERGVPVSGIFAEGPADRAGLRARDAILSLDGEPLSGPRDLVEKIRLREEGAWVSLGILRQGRELQLDVFLGERPAQVSGAGLRRGWIGIEAIELPATLRQHFGAPADSGVMVSTVVELGPAEAAGFRPGDVVYEVDGIPVRSLRALEGLVEGAGIGNEYVFAVARNGALLVLEAEIEEAPAKGR